MLIGTEWMEVQRFFFFTWLDMFEELGVPFPDAIATSWMNFPPLKSAMSVSISLAGIDAQKAQPRQNSRRLQSYSIEQLCEIEELVLAYHF